jgi:hypothetical protein
MMRAPTPPRSPVIVFIAVAMSITFSLAVDHQNLPAGTYATTITLDDVPDSFQALPKSALAGQWQVEFTQVGSVIVRRNGNLAAEGRYSSSPGSLEMTDVLGPYACGPEVGRYGWTLNEGELTLTAEADSCVGRVAVLTTRPLLRLVRSAVSGGPHLISLAPDEGAAPCWPVSRQAIRC